MNTKVCTKCGIEKDVSLFGPRYRKKDNSIVLDTKCKICRNKEKLEYKYSSIERYERRKEIARIFAKKHRKDSNVINNNKKYLEKKKENTQSIKTRICRQCKEEKDKSCFKTTSNLCKSCATQNEKNRHIKSNRIAHEKIKLQRASIKTRICRQCKEEKDKSCFNYHCNICKSCAIQRKKEYNKTYIKKNKDKLKIWRYLYREKNKDKIKVQTHLYREKNKDKIKEYLILNKERLNKRKQEYKKKNKDKVKIWCANRWKRHRVRLSKLNHDIYFKNIEKNRLNGKIRANNNRKNLTDTYIKSTIKNSPAKIIQQYPELIELKREIIKAKRVIKKLS